jgi:DUF971 family protein
MSMAHKVYAFDWLSFRRELHDILFEALRTGDPANLLSVIASNRQVLTDPGEGEPLSEEWFAANVDAGDVHQVGEVALTRFFDPAEDWGLQYKWKYLDRSLAESARKALLGHPFGPSDNPFDPGKQGSYFQTPREVIESIAILQAAKLPDFLEVQAFCSLLNEAAGNQQGLYVTF